MRTPLFLVAAAGLLSTETAAQSGEPERTYDHPTWHYNAAFGVGAAYGLVGPRVEVGFGVLSGFGGAGLGTGAIVNAIGWSGGLRLASQCHSGPVLSVHTSGAWARRTQVESYNVIGATVGWQFRFADFLRIELGIGPAYSFLRTYGVL